MKGQLRVGSVLAAVLVVVGTCGAGGTAPRSSHRPAQGGSITVLEPTDHTNGEWTGFDPAVANVPPSEFQSWVLGSLFDLGPHYSLVPDLATGYKLTNGGLTLTISLRQDLREIPR